ncbi:MAG: hypothetical protein JSS65_06615 [Armatimonadetes bacterium]|nr:hypothetical protein [Armatimonadota bacterium]
MNVSADARRGGPDAGAMGDTRDNTARKSKTNKVFFTPDRIAYVLVFVLAVALYYRSLYYVAVWDDHALMTGEALGGGTFWGALTKPFLGQYYRPLTSLSYWFDFQNFRSNIFLWHQSSILLHAFGAMVAGMLGKAVSGNKWVGVLAAAAFAVQPSQVAAAAWVGGRTDVLSALVVPLFLLLTVKFFQTDKGRYLVGATLVLYVAAMVKEQNLAILLAVPALQAAFGTPTRKRLAVTATALAVPTIVFIATWLQYRQYASTTFPPSIVEGIARVGGCAANYFFLLVAPTSAPQATISLANFESIGWIAFGMAVLVGSLVAVWLVYKKDKVLAAVGACALALYFPVSNAIPMPSLLVGPYRVATVGALLAVLAAMLVERQWANKRPAVAVAVGVVIAFWAWATHRDMDVWKTEAGFFQAVAKHDPHSIIGQLNVVSSLIADRRFEEAFSASEAYLGWLMEGSDWRASLDAGKGLTMNARQSRRLEYNTGVRILDTKYLSGVVCNRATAMSGLGQTKQAKACFESALQIDPKCAPALFALGDIATPTDKELAVRLFKKAIAVRGVMAEYAHLGAILKDLGRYEEAAEAYRGALKRGDWLGDLWVDLAESEDMAGKSLLAQEAIAAAEGKLIANKDRFKEIKDRISRKSATLKSKG